MLTSAGHRVSRLAPQASHRAIGRSRAKKPSASQGDTSQRAMPLGSGRRREGRHDLRMPAHLDRELRAKRRVRDAVAARSAAPCARDGGSSRSRSRRRAEPEEVEHEVDRERSDNATSSSRRAPARHGARTECSSAGAARTTDWRARAPSPRNRPTKSQCGRWVRRGGTAPSTHAIANTWAECECHAQSWRSKARCLGQRHGRPRSNCRTAVPLAETCG